MLNFQYNINSLYLWCMTRVKVVDNDFYEATK